MKMNLPNKLTLARMVMVPFLMVFITFDFGLGMWSRLIAAAFFGLASLTDFVDGYLARKWNLVTNFGKFMDPLADKLMVFVALISLCYVTGRDEGATVYGVCLLAATVIVIFRELAVTSMRLVVNNASGIVVSANMLGKIKTNTQIVCVCCIILEPILLPFCGNLISFISCIVMTVFTLWSGLSYLKAYWPYIKSDS